MSSFKFVKADNEEFLRFYAVYKLSKYKVWYPASIQRAIDLYTRFFKQDAFWVEVEGKRVGGVILEPNWIGLFFLMPPFQDEYSLVHAVVKRSIEISDLNKPITAFGMVPETAGFLQQFGFQVVQTAKEMICATRQYDIQFDSGVYQDSYKTEYLKEMTDLYFEVFSQSKVASMAGKPYEFYEDLLKGQVDGIDPEYTTILRDSETNEMVGICTAQIWFEMPIILDLLVKATHQKRGLAEMMIRKMLTSACNNNYPAVCLSVVPGNPAENLYHRMGFLSAEAVSELKLEL